ncbi:MAG: radical SAM protein, partial [Peptoniphilus sp.]|nr:radical SAM protein [Peptoniphilus sp.]
VDALVEEISREVPYLKNRPTSIYIGGGTPTALSTEQIYKLLKVIEDNFKRPIEYTVECGRADTLNEEKLTLLKDFGVERISLNPQSAKESISKIINRPMDLKDFEKKYEIAKKLGFDSINMDLILGLPTERAEDMIRSIEYVSDLRAENITIHNLSLKKGSKLFEKNYHFESSIDDVIEFSKKYLHEKSYNPYYMYRQKKIIGNGENIGYSLLGKECIYNILIIEEVQDIVAFGMGSASKFVSEDGKVNQVLNFKNLRDYLNRKDEVFNRKLKYYTNRS